MNAKAATGKSAYEDLRSAIASHGLVRAEEGAIIIGAEYSSAREPWIFDFRALMMQPRWLNRYADIFWDLYKDRLPFQVGGVETAGIPLVAAIVMKSIQRGTPINGFYIRKSRKRHGLMKYIEGTLTDEPVVFVDDLINSGRTLNKQLDILEREGKTVSDIFTMLAFRAEDAYGHLKERGVSMRNLFTLEDFGLPLQRSRDPEIPADSFDVLWRYHAPDPAFQYIVQKSAPATDGSRVYVGCDDGYFRALDSDTGNVLWEFRVGKHPHGKAILSSPALYDDIIYFGAYDGTVYALECESGRKLWSYTDADWVGSSPDIDAEHGRVYIGLEYGLMRRRGGIVALDAKTGDRIWHASHTALTHGSPLYIGTESLVVIGSNDGVLYAYDAHTGALRWTFAARGEIKTRPTYDAENRLIIFGSMDGALYALSARDGLPVYVRETGAGIYSIPLIAAGAVYVASLDKCLYALDVASGSERWVFETSGRIFASPVIHNGSLWLGSNDGRLYELDPSNGKQRSFFQATERIVNRVAYSGEKIFVSTVANEIYCLRKKE